MGFEGLTFIAESHIHDFFERLFDTGVLHHSEYYDAALGHLVDATEGTYKRVLSVPAGKLAEHFAMYERLGFKLVAITLGTAGTWLVTVIAKKR